jgi:cytochrome bd-type quinol oxidase subunit 2
MKLPPDQNVVIRFKGDVPIFILIPHIIAMFGAMLLSTRTGLEFFKKEPELKKLTYWTIGFLFIGGFILGPLVQEYAFGALWTGFPFGHDLTDNKTLIAMLGWLGALFMYRKSREPKRWALFAALLLLIVYMIPHSLLGSELDYSKQETIEKVE